MSSRGLTNQAAPDRDLVSTVSQPSSVRNCLTSIFWVPHVDSQKLLLSSCTSDHVHYYQGGLPFEYMLYHPSNQKFETIILGPDIQNGHVLQMPVPGGTWKCGRLLIDEAETTPPYSIIAEAVAPGFDVQDFQWLSPLSDQGDKIKEEVTAKLLPFVHPSKVAFTDTGGEFDKYYDKKDKN